MEREEFEIYTPLLCESSLIHFYVLLLFSFCLCLFRVISFPLDLMLFILFAEFA